MCRVVTNCTTVFCLHLMYNYNSYIHFSFRASVFGGYPQNPFSCLFGSFPVIRRTTGWWKYPLVRAMQGVTTQVCDPKSSVTCTTTKYNFQSVLKSSP